MNPVPLTSPNGVLYGYACGTCHELAKPGESMDAPPPGPRPRTVEWSREEAERCCRCLTCDDPRPRGSDCAKCSPGEATRAEEGRRAWIESRKTAANARRAEDKAGAAQQLLDVMRDMSEDFWCSAWTISTEHDLWAMLDGADRHWGMGEVLDEEVEALRRLSTTAGGWWIWNDGEQFVTLDEWALIRKGREELKR